MFLIDWIVLNFKKFRGILSFALCVAISFALMSMSYTSKKVFHEVAIITVLAPITYLVSIKKKYFKVIEKNELLRKQNAALNVENDLLRQYRQQNQRLRDMLDFKLKSGYNLIPGEVISRDPGRYEMSWIVNLGETDSVSVNMPVLTVLGVVGKVRKVFSNYCVVQLLKDPNCKISVMNQRSRFVGILESYKSDKLIARFPVHADVVAGDTLVTSGLGGVFPKGLSLGIIVNSDLESNGIIKGSEVIAFQDMDLAEEIFVYKKDAGWNIGAEN